MLQSIQPITNYTDYDSLDNGLKISYYFNLKQINKVIYNIILKFEGKNSYK